MNPVSKINDHDQELNLGMCSRFELDQERKAQQNPETSPIETRRYIFFDPLKLSIRPLKEGLVLDQGFTGDCTLHSGSSIQQRWFVTPTFDNLSTRRNPIFQFNSIKEHLEDATNSKRVESYIEAFRGVLSTIDTRGTEPRSIGFKPALVSEDDIRSMIQNNIPFQVSLVADSNGKYLLNLENQLTNDKILHAVTINGMVDNVLSVSNSGINRDSQSFGTRDHELKTTEDLIRALRASNTINMGITLPFTDELNISRSLNGKPESGILIFIPSDNNPAENSGLSHRLRLGSASVRANVYPINSQDNGSFSINLAGDLRIESGNASIGAGVLNTAQHSLLSVGAQFKLAESTTAQVTYDQMGTLGTRDASHFATINQLDEELIDSNYREMNSHRQSNLKASLSTSFSNRMNASLNYSRGEERSRFRSSDPDDSPDANSRRIVENISITLGRDNWFVGYDRTRYNSRTIFDREFSSESSETQQRIFAGYSWSNRESSLSISASKPLDGRSPQFSIFYSRRL